MTFLFPWAFLWLGSVPVLIWLWRHAASHKQIHIPSLVPFEHLLRRAPQQRTRLLVNLLFWLQLACLACAVFALTQPALLGRRARTTLVIVDTSASMSASLGGPTPLQQARSWLLSRLARKPPGERWFVVTSAPVASLTPQPISDAFQLRRLLEELSTSAVAGNLAMAVRIGRGLAGEPFDAMLVATDEPLPPTNLAGQAGAPTSEAPGVEVRSFGTALPNVALVGVDASVPLCVSEDSPAHVLVLVHNFSNAAQDATLMIRRDGHTVAKQTVSLAPSARASVSLDLPDAAPGPYDIRLSAKRDALAVDDRAVIERPSSERLPVAIASDDARFIDTIGRWLEACPRITWRPLRNVSDAGPLAEPSELLVTDQPDAGARWPGGSVAFAARPASPRLRSGLSETRSAEEGRASQPRVRLTHWLVDSTHPLGAYLESVETVAASLAAPIDSAPRQRSGPALGTAAVWGVLEGRRVPLVIAEERAGRRRVVMRFDPSATPDSVPMILVFLNSLRWLSGTSANRLANFLDPAESNTMQRVSTWDRAAAVSDEAGSPRRSHEPLAGWLIVLFLVVWLAEWWLYSLRAGRRS